MLCGCYIRFNIRFADRKKRWSALLLSSLFSCRHRAVRLFRAGTQVFIDEGNAFAALRQGLSDASSGGSSLGTATTSFLQNLTTGDNPVANIEGGRQVTVLSVLQQPCQHVAGRDNRSGNSTGSSERTTSAAHRTAAKLPESFHGRAGISRSGSGNILAQLSAWNVQQLESEILGLVG